MTLKEKQELRKELSTNIQYTRKKNSLRMEVYIQAEYRDAVEVAMEWAYENKQIPRKTKWTYAKFCIINTSRMILKQIEKDKLERKRAENSQGVPTTYQQTDSGNRMI